MVLKTAPEVLYKGIKVTIGTPEDWSKNNQKGSFPVDYNTKIPLPSTDDDDIEAALNQMRISEFSDEEQKGGFTKGNNVQERRMPFANAASDASMYMPVKALNQFSTDWRIKVRVTKKSDMRKWNNARGTGELFNVDLVDVDGAQI